MGREDRFAYRKMPFDREREESPGPWHYVVSKEAARHKSNVRCTFGVAKKFCQYRKIVNAPGPASYNVSCDPRVAGKEFSIPKVVHVLTLVD